VLDDYGDGDLGTLLKGLNTFLSKVEDRKLDLSGAVINLSLGIVEIPDGCKLSKEYSELWHVLGVADSSGIVIVAAAGNRSNRSLKPPVVTAPDIPAQWNDRVIAVAASNGKAQVACFSNEGVIYAPGGDGDSNCSPVKCQSGASDQCKSGVVSLVTLSKTGYGYWSGTSFATPLVSGLAALCMQKLYTDQHPLSAPTGVASTIRDKIQQSGTSRSTTNSTPMPPAIIDAKELLFNKCK
jgi:subtilisin family serine protease